MNDQRSEIITMSTFMYKQKSNMKKKNMRKFKENKIKF